MVVFDGIEKVAGGLVGEVGGGEEMGNGGAGGSSAFARFPEVGFDEGAVTTSEADEGVEGFADSCALSPTGSGSSGERNDSDFSVGESLLAKYEIF